MNKLKYYVSLLMMVVMLMATGQAFAQKKTATTKPKTSVQKKAAPTKATPKTSDKKTTAKKAADVKKTSSKPVAAKPQAPTSPKPQAPKTSKPLSAVETKIQADSVSASSDLCSEADSVAVDTLADMLKVRKKGNILIVGKGQKIRACNPFSYTQKKMADYAGLINEYQDTFPNVKVYYIAIPTSYEFYVPESAKTVKQREAIDVLFQNLNNKVVKVDAYNELLQHVDEPIYSRTDHHWAPLGAFYAAKSFAEAAKVSFPGLEAYERRVVRDYVGSMYRFTKDIALKQAPEEFYYYIPTKATYNTTYIHYTLNKATKQVASETEPKEGNFFRIFKDGNGSAYCTFMGGDERLTRVQTQVGNGRRVLILKDSFGNALSSFLFYSFEQVHVVDCRYFTKNLIDYVRDNNITDIVFANNIAHTSAETVANYRKYLAQGRPVRAVETPADVVEAQPAVTIQE